MDNPLRFFRLVLSLCTADSLVTIYPLPDLVPPTPLHQTRTAFSFALHSGIERVSPDGKPQAFEEVAAAKSLGVPTIVTTLVIGCQRRLLILTWRDGEIQEPRVCLKAGVHSQRAKLHDRKPHYHILRGRFRS